MSVELLDLERAAAVSLQRPGAQSSDRQPASRFAEARWLRVARRAWRTLPMPRALARTAHARTWAGLAVRSADWRRQVAMWVLAARSARGGGRGRAFPEGGGVGRLEIGFGESRRLSGSRSRGDRW